MKQQIVKGMTIDDIQKVQAVCGNGMISDIYVIGSTKMIDTYQGRIYANSKEECLDAVGNIDVDKMHEFVSVAFQHYCDHPGYMKKGFRRCTSW